MISPRAKIIECLKSDREDVSNCLKEIFAQSAITSNAKKCDSKSDKNASKKCLTTLKPVEVNKTAQQRLDPQWDTSTLYDKFKMKIRACEGFVLRYNKEKCQLAVMNDYDPFT